jgi:excisionase family DNA binding protein
VGRGKVEAKEPDGRKWLTVTQAAKYAGIGRTTFNDWVREGRLPFRDYPFAHKIRKIDQADLDAWIKSREEGPGTGPVYPRKRKQKEAACKE